MSRAGDQQRAVAAASSSTVRDARPPRGVCRTVFGSVKGSFTDSESMKDPFTDLCGLCNATCRRRRTLIVRVIIRVLYEVVRAVRLDR
ncbi:hypothetical protein ATK36_1677 [Amycolatopsis sulphurea]|uniref:Uncharacterized protein n=1 Tax=Amycolatopsis sulphurea TaxID=76022 RepID=A0A2A9F8D2_9PSEU|nr:hypothetical protein ATK36_1677 [Amycolatopsis sulphurea]